MKFPLVKLGDICDLFNGYAFKSSDYVDKSNTLSCRMSNIRPGGRFDIGYNPRYLPDEFSEKYDQFKLKDNDVVIAMTDLADSPKILGVPTVIKTNGKNILLNQRVGKLLIREPSQIYFPYLQLALNSPNVRSIYKKFAGGGLQINLGKKDLLSVQIPLPPLAEQKQIAAILDAADSLRQKDQQLVEHYTALSQSLFLEMFGDPTINQKNWEKKALGKIFKLSSGKGLSAKEMDVTGSYPVYGGNGINGYHSEFMFKESQLIIGRVGAYCGVVHISEPYSWITDNALYIKEKYEEFNMQFMASLLILLDLNQYAGKAAQPLVSGSRIHPLEVVFPSLSLQNQFAERIAIIEQQKQQAQANLKKSEALFNSLLQRAFTGELTANKAA